MTNKIEWVDDEVVNKIKRGRNASNDITQIIEQLYANPMKWAKLPFQMPASSSVNRITKRFNGIEATMTGGNNLRIDDPNKKNWTVFLRFNPQKDKGD